MPTKEKTCCIPEGKMIKLGTIFIDLATGLKGMATHMLIEPSGVRRYIFQPRGINPETGGPVENFWLPPERAQKPELVDEPDLPLYVLGTDVEDKASGFNGTAVALVMHLNGCIHVSVQPKGKLSKTNTRIEPHDFDIRRLEGKAIKKLDQKEKEESQRRKPGPAVYRSYSPPKPIL